MRARRRDGEGRKGGFSEVAKREKASRISDSVDAVMLCSFARAERRGVGSLGAVGAGARRFGGYGDD